MIVYPACLTQRRPAGFGLPYRRIAELSAHPRHHSRNGREVVDL
eukprot:COSAG02_NODE_56470_length_285_cov_1.037634_1_plen_43_part_01